MCVCVVLGQNVCVSVCLRRVLIGRPGNVSECLVRCPDVCMCVRVQGTGWSSRQRS